MATAKGLAKSGFAKSLRGTVMVISNCCLVDVPCQLLM
jgi:hypothetical protein